MNYTMTRKLTKKVTVVEEPIIIEQQTISMPQEDKSSLHTDLSEAIETQHRNDKYLE